MESSGQGLPGSAGYLVDSINQDGPANSMLASLKLEISELGSQVDSYRAKTAGALGGAVFLLLLAAGGAYDVINHNNTIGFAIGISPTGFQAVVIALGVVGLVLALVGIFRQTRRDTSLELRLAQLERDLVDHQDRYSGM